MAALRHSAATALASRLRSLASPAALSETASTSTSLSSSFFVRFFSTSSERGGEGSVHFDDGSGEKLAEVLDHALVRRGAWILNRKESRVLHLVERQPD